MGDSKFTIVDVGKLSKPLTKLIESVSGAVGAVYEPTRIRRKAKAEADAMLIFADTEIEVAKRAARRLAVQEVRKQENIEAIFDSATKLLPETVSEEPVDPDWMSRFFADAADVSDEHLQKIWAKLLAQEVAAPGRCSRRTLGIVKELSRLDAECFEQLCRLVWYGEDFGFVPIDEDYDDGVSPEMPGQPLRRYGVQFDDCLQLDALGLLQCQSFLEQTLSTGSVIAHGQSIYVLFGHPVSGRIEPFDAYPLTRSGLELFRIVEAEASQQFHEDTLKLLVRHGAKIACPLLEGQSAETWLEGECGTSASAPPR